MVHRTELGEIRITDEALAELAGLACTRCYGVVGMAGQSLQDGVAELLGRESLTRGVRLKRKGDQVSIHLYVILEAGVNIAEVARNLVEQVRYVLRRSAGLEVDDVQVHVQGVRTEK